MDDNYFTRKLGEVAKIEATAYDYVRSYQLINAHYYYYYYNWEEAWCSSDSLDRNPNRLVYMRGSVLSLVGKYSLSYGGHSPNGWCERVIKRYLRMTKYTSIDDTYSRHILNLMRRIGKKHPVSDHLENRLLSRGFKNDWWIEGKKVEFYKTEAAQWYIHIEDDYDIPVYDEHIQYIKKSFTVIGIWNENKERGWREKITPLSSDWKCPLCIECLDTKAKPQAFKTINSRGNLDSSYFHLWDNNDPFYRVESANFCKDCAKRFQRVCRRLEYASKLLRQIRIKIKENANDQSLSKSTQ